MKKFKKAFVLFKIAAILTIAGMPIHSQAVETAPQAQYFIPQPDTALFANEFLPDPPHLQRQEFYPTSPVVPDPPIAPPPDTAALANEFYPEPDTVSRVDFIPAPQTAPLANEFIPQAAIAPTAQEFYP